MDKFLQTTKMTEKEGSKQRPENRKKMKSTHQKSSNKEKPRTRRLH